MTIPPKERTTVNVVGLGYVGVEICLAAISAGHRVAAIDSDETRLADLRRPAREGHDEWAKIRAACRADQLELHATARAAPRAEVWIVAVPTPLDAAGRPDTSNVSAAAHAIAAVVPPYATVVLESTSYPGTTEDLFLPPFVAAGRTPGVDLFVGFSPERINPGNGTWPMPSIPKVVSGCTDACLKAVAEFYATIVDTVHPVSSPRIAEMAKLYENSWRLVNVSFANEIEALCTSLGVDPWEVSAACRTKPFGYFGFDPGPGAGGHCIPVDAAYLSVFATGLSQQMPVLDSAIASNRHRPNEVVRRIMEQISNQHRPTRSPRVLLVGVAYKANVADTRESSAIAIIEQLERLAVAVDFHDPLVATLELRHGTRTSVELTPESLSGYDCVAVLCSHLEVQWDVLRGTLIPIVDMCNALPASAAVTLVADGQEDVDRAATR